jgi:capsule biosynthesis phosphatase
MKSIVFDLDDTICYPNHDETDTYRKYGCAAPNQRIINCIKQLQSEEYYVIISSARRMVTHDGDIDMILADVGYITINWLKEHNVPYNELQFGKPYSSTYYVDDKACDLDKFYKLMESGKL